MVVTFCGTQERKRGQKFLAPKNILGRIPEPYGTEGVPRGEKKVWIKYFGGEMTFYVVELDPKELLAFGFVVSYGESEMDWFSLPEIEKATRGIRVAGREIRVPAFERDMNFSPCFAKDVPDLNM